MPKENRSAAKKTIKPGKKIITSMIESLRTQLLTAFNQGVKEITLDFNGVETMDSKGLGLLIAAYNSSNNIGGKLKIKNASEKICKFLNTTRLDKYFEVISPG
jgi:anti-anti-sigma factor